MGGVYEHLNFQKYDYFIPVIEGKSGMSIALNMHQLDIGTTFQE